MDSAKIRDEQQLAMLIEEIRPHSKAAQISRLSKIRESLELDEMYYQQKGNETGMTRTGRCLGIIDVRLAELQP